MKLKHLSIYPQHFSKEGYRVTAEFEAYGNEVKLTLPKEVGERIVALCMDEIVSAVQQVATVTAESLIRGPEVAALELEHEEDSA